MTSALWQDRLSQLSVEDHTTFYGRFVMKLVSREEGLEIEELHEQAEQQDAERAAAAAAVEAEGQIDIFAGDGDETDNIVDQITGQQHNVDTSRGYRGTTPDRSGQRNPSEPSNDEN